MRRAARVLIVGAVASRAAETAQALTARGYSTIITDPDDALTELLASRRPDVVLFDQRGVQAQTSAADAVKQFAKDIRDTVLWQQLPFLMLNEGSDGYYGQDALLLIDELNGDPTDAEMDHRISSLARLGTMRGELQRRIRTMDKMGLNADATVTPPGFIQNPHILISGVGIGLPKIQSALGEEATVFGVPTASLALDHLENFDVDLVCIDATENLQQALESIASLRRMPRWCALPIVVTTLPQTSDQDRKLLHNYGATDLISLEEDDAFSASRITLLIREHRFANAIQTAFSTIAPEIADPQMGLPSAQFALAHMIELVHDCDRHGDGFSVVGIRVDQNSKAGTYASAIASVLKTIVRGEDLAVAMPDGLFLVLLPGTDGPQARIVRDRLSAVLGSTDFGVDEFGLPRIAPISYNVTPYKPGDTAETMLARVLDSFDGSPEAPNRIETPDLVEA